MNFAALSRIALAFTFVWLLGWALWALRRLLRRDQNSLLFAILLIFVLYGVPAGIDFAFGIPSYFKFPGYYRACHDPRTVAVACGYISLVPICWWFFVRKRVKPLEAGLPLPSRLRTSHRLILHLGVLAPLLALLLAPDPMVYRTYGAAALRILTPYQQEYHHVLALLCTFAVLAAAGLVSGQRRLVSPQTFYLALMSLGAIWLHGKRSVVAFAAFVIGYQLWRRGWLSSKRLLPSLLVAALLLVGYTQIYQRLVREIDSTHTSTAEYVERARLDFCRDHVLRLVIHAELNAQARVLEHRGQSFLFIATVFVPRSIWPEKPLPYARYVVSAAYGVPPQYWGWGHPSSILDESLANLGWIGALLGPLFVAGIATLGNRARTPRSRALTALVVVSFLHVQLVSFAPVALVWFLILVLDLRRNRREPRAGRPPSTVLLAPKPESTQVAEAESGVRLFRTNTR